jgi:PAS domain S-box-containing protein
MANGKQSSSAPSHQQCLMLLESLREGVTVVADHRTVFINPRARELLGYKADEKPDDGLLDLIHPVDRPTVEDRYQRQFVSDGMPVVFECRIVDRKGNRRWLENRVSGIEWQDQPAILTTFSDITSRKRAETALKVLSECNQAVVRATDEASLMHDVCRILTRQGGYRLAWVGFAEQDEQRSVRPVAQAGFEEGYLDTVDITWRDEERGRGPSGRALREGRPVVMRDIASDPAFRPWRKEALKRGYSSSIALPLTIDGQRIGVLNIYSAMTDDFDVEETNLLQEMALDLAYGIQHIRARSELVQSHELLKASEHRYRKLADATSEAVAIHHQGKLLDVNHAFEVMFGYSYEEAVGMSALDMAAPESRETVLGNIRSGYEGSYEASGLRRDGSSFPALLRSINFTYQGLPARLTTLRDLTEQKQMQQQLLRAQKMESVGRLAGGIAHDFNNYLTAVQGYIELALMDLGKRDPARGDLEEALESTERAATLTRQLLMFSRRGRLERKAVDLNRLVKELSGMLERILGERYELVTRLETGAPAIDGDAGLLEQATVNLAVNARDAMPEGGRITISTGAVEETPAAAAASPSPEAHAGSFAVISVSDEGTGMDRSTMERIFEPFFSTKEEKEGTGLGLAVVYGIVTEHDGWIEVESEPGRGSTFELFLPVFTGVEADQPDAPAHTGDSRHRGAAILLVEDEEPLRAVANKMLSQCGYRVWAAADAEEALRLFNEKDGAFDLAFCDVVLPGKNGVELAERLLEQTPDLKVLLASGYSEESVQRVITERGYRFLPKPYRLEKLVELIEEMLGDVP